VRQRRLFVTGIAVTACLTVFGLAVITHAKDDDRPSSQQIAFAKDGALVVGVPVKTDDDDR
jgi:hypothetical protein